MTDLMDQRLSTAARRWQADQPAPPSVPVERLDEPLPRTRAWRPLTAAAAAAVVVTAGLVAATRAHDSGTLPPSTGSPTSHASGFAGPVVRWRDLPATHPKVGHRVHGRWVTKYDNVFSSGVIRGRLHPGDTLVFTVVLLSSTDLTLDPCPDFNVAFGRGFGFVRQLNCSDVPFHNAHGRPELPANTQVGFEIQVPVPDEHGRQKVLWTIDGPFSAPGFYGMVRVLPTY